jgi:hypothetical protein
MNVRWSHTRVSKAVRTIVTLLVGLPWFVSSASAAVIDLDFDALPSAQGWTFFTSTDTQEADVFSVDGTALHQNSIGIFDDPKYIWQGILENRPFDVQFRARLTEYDGPSPEPWAFTVIVGSPDLWVFIGLGPGFIGIEPNGIRTEIVLVDTFQFHEYRLLGNPDAGSYTIFIDGQEVLSQVVGQIHGTDSFLMIGDRLLGIGPPAAPVGAKADLTRFVFDYVAREPFEVEIDIKPGEFPNSINPKSKGVIPVAIQTTESFDATTVDPLSIKFGPNGAPEVHLKGHVEDADGDGDDDLVLHFDTQATGIQCGDTSASLTGETFDGNLIQGSDSIKTVGC